MGFNRPEAHGVSSDPGRAGYRSLLPLLLAIVIAGVAWVGAYASSQSPRVTTTANPELSAISPPQAATLTNPDVRQVIETYCVVCHNQRAGTADLAFDTLDVANPSAHPATWEKVIRKLRTGTMPPGGMPRPDANTYAAVATYLEDELDRAWAANPNPGRINSVHRLNRTEYNNAIRDIFALDIDVTSMLPGDETADGSFDNFASVLTISPSHLDRYLAVARHITRLAVGLPPMAPVVSIVRIPEMLVQNDLMAPDLPLGSRGGIAVAHHFPVDGEYTIKVTLQRMYQDYMRGMGWPQLLDVRLDGKLLRRFTVGGGATQYRPTASSYAGDGEPGYEGDPEWDEYMQVGGDAGMEIRLFVPAGPHVVGVAFPRDSWIEEGLPQEPQRGAVWKNDNEYMGYAAVHEVHIGGPYQLAGPSDDTPSRREIFSCQPRAVSEEVACATEILSRMARRAYRRPVTDQEVGELLDFFRQGREEGGSFDSGVQFALEILLVNPDFLLRVYRDPASAPVASSSGFLPRGVDPFPLSDLEIASRLAFFLWSSIPDETLLALAEQGKLIDRQVLRQQAQRMLDDPRAADALVKGFASQWLNLRLVDEYVPDTVVFSEADDNLLRAFRTETEMFVGSTIREDRGVLELLTADYTFVNERLARHYGIPDVYGSRFRRVTLPDLEQRGGLLGHGGLLAVTSYPNRTSPVLRGKWLLDNILGSPVPPPPPSVDTTLEETPASANATIRERLARHRTDPVCSTCHSVLDPLGFALESFDALGGWRTLDETGQAVDNVGTWPSGLELNGFVGLREMLVAQGDQFAENVTAKLMSYAYGRRLEYYDQPAVRKIVREGAATGYRWSSIILGIVESPGFLMRAAETD